MDLTGCVDDLRQRLVLLDALSAAAGEISAELAPGSVDVRLRAGDPEFVVAGILVLFTLALTWLAVIPGLTATSADGAGAFSYPARSRRRQPT